MAIHTLGLMETYSVSQMTSTWRGMKNTGLNYGLIEPNYSTKILRRIQASIEKALLLSNGLLSVTISGDYQLISSKRACPIHGHTAPELEPRLFSFNDPQGQCGHCLGLGYVEEFDFDAMFEPNAEIDKAFIPFGEDNRLPFSHLDQHMWYHCYSIKSESMAVNTGSI